MTAGQCDGCDDVATTTVHGMGVCFACAMEYGTAPAPVGCGQGHFDAHGAIRLCRDPACPALPRTLARA